MQAVAEKFLEARLGSTMMQHKIYAYISDGAVEEEISQGVGRIAGNLGLNNLIMFYDSNDIQALYRVWRCNERGYRDEVQGLGLECHQDQR